MKLLFLACCFRPAQATACVRTWNIAKYLARLDWDVTVVTPHPSIWRNVEDPERVTEELTQEGIKRVFTNHRWRCLYPGALNCRDRGLAWFMGGISRRVARYFGIDNGIGWIKEAESACESFTPEDVDVILATAPPFSAFILARRLAKRLGRPYILDYRDPWVFQHGTRLTKLRSTRKLEESLIKDSDGVTLISKSLLGDIRVEHEKLQVVTNGYDPEDMVRIKPYDFGHFAIVYAGVFRPPVTVITPVMKALKLLKEQAGLHEWKFHYYGPHDDHVCDEAKRFDVTEKVIIHGRVPRAEALSAVRGSGVTIVITSVLEVREGWEKGIVTGKLFEPLGMCVPVLVIGPDGTDVEEIIGTAGSAHKVSASNIGGIATFLRELMSGKLPSAKSPELYAWPNTIGRLDSLLRKAITGSEKRLNGHVLGAVSQH